MNVAYAADESYPEDQWCIPQDGRRKSYYRISQRPRSPSSVSELLQPSVAPASAVGTSHRKTFFILGVMYSVHFEQGNIREKQMDHSDETWKEYMIVKIGCPSMSK